MNETTITRRSALRSGTLAALAAGLLGMVGTPPVDAAPDLTIDRAEQLILELLGIVPALSGRDRSNVSHVLELTTAAIGQAEPQCFEALAEAVAYIGPGNRVHDVIDREIAARRRAAVTHAAVVARYAAGYHAGGVDAGTVIRDELAGRYGDDLGKAIAGAAFDQYLHALYHVDRGRCNCAEAA